MQKAIPEYIPMTSEGIKAIQAAWHPATQPAECFSYRPADLRGLHWVDCAYVEKDRSANGRYYEDVVIPKGHVNFEPILSPMRMLEIGIFGNAYFGSMRADTKYPLGRERAALLPSNRWKGYVGSDKPNWNTALFKKKASLTRAWWLERGLIADCDPLGQFEWYCWYWLGRRIPAEDAHQIGRWTNFRIRQSAMLNARPGMIGLQQALLHWSCDPWICS